MSDETTETETVEAPTYVDPIVAMAQAAAAESIAFAEELATPSNEPAEIHVENFGEAIAEAERAAGLETMDEKTRNTTNPDSDSTDGAPPVDDEAPDADDDGYEAEGVTRDDLAEMLKRRELPHTGSKAELIARLRENDSEQA